jgi:hypothetical protein
MVELVRAVGGFAEQREMCLADPFHERVVVSGAACQRIGGPRNASISAASIGLCAASLSSDMSGRLRVNCRRDAS